jgi:hypothetical protein
LTAQGLRAWDLGVETSSSGTSSFAIGADIVDWSTEPTHGVM